MRWTFLVLLWNATASTLTAQHLLFVGVKLSSTHLQALAQYLVSGLESTIRERHGIWLSILPRLHTAKYKRGLLENARGAPTSGYRIPQVPSQTHDSIEHRTPNIVILILI